METVTQTQFDKELWRRVELEQFMGYTALRRTGQDQSTYILTTAVQLELDYGD